MITIREIKWRLMNLFRRSPSLSVGAAFSGCIRNARPEVLRCPSCGSLHTWVVITPQVGIGVPMDIYMADILRFGEQAKVKTMGDVRKVAAEYWHNQVRKEADRIKKEQQQEKEAAS